MSWPLVKLHDICKPKQWKTIAASNLLEAGYPVYGANGKIGFYSDFTHELPTLMITCRGATCGNVHISEPKSYINGNAMALDDIDSSIVLIKYLYYFFLKRKFNDVISGSAQPQITGQGLTKVEIPLPPLAEQKRIAAILDKADAIRRKREQAVQLADDFLRAVFLDMFGDPVMNPKGFPISKLGDFCEDLFLGLTSKVDYIDGRDGFPLIRAKDINTGELSLDGARYISEKQHQKLTKNHLTRKGDLLVSKSGTLGTCAIVRTDREFSTYESIFTVRPSKTKLDIHYLIHLLQNKGFKERLVGNKVGGTVAHLNLKMFRDFEIGIPPIELQTLFSKTIIKCETKLEKYRKSSLESDFLFNSVSQKAFSGKL